MKPFIKISKTFIASAFFAATLSGCDGGAFRCNGAQGAFCSANDADAEANFADVASGGDGDGGTFIQ